MKTLETCLSEKLPYQVFAYRKIISATQDRFAAVKECNDVVNEMLENHFKENVLTEIVDNAMITYKDPIIECIYPRWQIVIAFPNVEYDTINYRLEVFFSPKVRFNV